VDGHLFAFEFRGEANEGDDHVSLTASGSSRPGLGDHSIEMPAPKSFALWMYSTRSSCGLVSLKVMVKRGVSLERNSAPASEAKPATDLPSRETANLS
jgi:hypothetical protein